MKIKNILLTLCTSLLLTNVAAHAKEVKIGMAIDDLRLERWQKDRDIFVKKAESLGAKVFVQSANGNEETQMSQIENMINRGVDVLVIIPYNGQVLSNVVKEAKQEGIKVLAYDRMINDADIDFYISFDNEKVGELQAKALVDIVPQGNYFLMGGSPVDNNAKLFRAGQMKVLKPYVDSGKIKVVGDQWVDGWLPENALKIMENALTANNNKIDAVVASNDATAGGAIQALSAQGLSGKVAISGQDADLAGIKRIAAGTQTMTVYKPITLLANTAAAWVNISTAGWPNWSRPISYWGTPSNMSRSVCSSSFSRLSLVDLPKRMLLASIAASRASRECTITVTSSARRRCNVRRPGSCLCSSTRASIVSLSRLVNILM